jgi:hypothetical protein
MINELKSTTWGRWLAVVGMSVACHCHAANYYVHPVSGDDSNSGISPQTPLRTLERAAKLSLQAGDRVLLAAGQAFAGQLVLDGIAGTVTAPIIVSTYTANEATTNVFAIIDAKGHAAGVFLRNAAHVQVANLHITGNSGGMRAESRGNRDMRCGVLVQADRAGDYAGLSLSNLVIRDVFYEAPGFVRSAEEVKTANGTQRYGWGIRFMVNSSAATMTDIVVRDCEIRNVSHTGLKFTAPTNGMQNVTVQRLRVDNSGGPGVQMSGLRGGHFSEMEVTGSGSTNDSRNWSRGSGLWTWQTSDVVIERSRFLNANGPGDSAGVHIDYHCRNIIVQYNLSANNAGGFCEVLGNNHNIAYRYNVSVNDGHRVKGRAGAFQEGKTFWLSGYTGDKSPRRGPFNTYFYNNTIYVGADRVAKFAIAPTTEGLLIANNIFCIAGDSQLVAGDQLRRDALAATALPNVVFENNLYLKPDNWPAAISIQDASPLSGDPKFSVPGGLKVEDYVPRNVAGVKNRGVEIKRIPNDRIGLMGGLKMDRDILGRPIVDAPDLGAIELVEVSGPQLGSP